MDTFDIGKVNYNELYKLHTGHVLYDSDSDSSDSTTSNNSFWVKHKPPLYSYEDLQANTVLAATVVTKPIIQSKAELKVYGANEILKIGPGDSIQKQIIKKELKLLILEDSCRICNVMKCSKHDIENHKSGKNHKKNVDQYIKDRLEKLKSKETAVQMNKSSRVNQSSFSSSNTSTSRQLAINSVKKVVKPSIGPGNSIQKQIIKKELKLLILEDSCRICNVMKCSKHDIENHKTGKNHKVNVDQYIKDRLEKLKSQETAVQMNKSSRVNQSSFSSSNTSTSRQLAINSVKKVVKPSIANSSDKILQEKLKRLLCSNYCHLCNAMLPNTDQFESHYKSSRHQTVLNAWKSNEIEMLKHSRINKISESDKRNNAFYCHICKITYSSKSEMDEHIKSFPHNKIAGLMSLIVSMGISTTLQPFWKFDDKKIICNLCEIYCKNESDAASHFGSKRHATKFNTWCSWQSRNMKDLNRRWYYCDVCIRPLDGTTNVDLHYQGVPHALNNAYYCHICKITYSSKFEMDEHIKSFPHNKVAGLMSLIVSMGISTIQPFWKFDDREIICNLCEIYCKNESAAASHFGSKRHVTKFNTWCSGQSRNTKGLNRRWYYCDVCMIPLDGTTNVVLHYQEAPHALKENSSTNISQATNSCTSTDIIKSDTSAKTNTSTTKNCDNFHSTENGEDAAYLQELVRAETDKLIHIVRSIPVDDAINFLQKCIEELEIVGKKFKLEP